MLILHYTTYTILLNCYCSIELTVTNWWTMFLYSCTCVMWVVLACGMPCLPHARGPWACQGGVHMESIWVILIQQDVLELHYIASYLCHGWTGKVMKTKSVKDRFWAQALQIGFKYPFQTITIHYILHPKYDTLCTKVSADRNSNHIRAQNSKSSDKVLSWMNADTKYGA